MGILDIFKRREHNIKFVHDSDIENYLKTIGLFEEVQKGTMKCVFCGNKISLDNLSILFPEEKSLKVVCSKPKCVNKVNNVR